MLRKSVFRLSFFLVNIGYLISLINLKMQFYEIILHEDKKLHIYLIFLREKP